MAEMMTPDLSPIDLPYMLTLGLTVLIGAALIWRGAHPAIHALVAGLILFIVGWFWTINGFNTKMSGASTANILENLPSLPPSSSLVGPGQSALVAALWLGILRNWLGRNSKIICIVAIWALILLAPIAYHIYRHAGIVASI